ncbi:hypothetical protein [Marispirochaeta sp.]|uniref:hypothetical protein n=1 Tax=Marispirochaeta sp. TaxID=2038653 RepID=UPI0029C91A63|nr:hypothetical protein [Marispirochaeta sp.]
MGDLSKFRSVRLREDTVEELKSFAVTVGAAGKTKPPSLSLLIQAAIYDMLDRRYPDSWTQLAVDIEGDPKKATQKWSEWLKGLKVNTQINNLRGPENLNHDEASYQKAIRELQADFDDND